MPYVLALVPMIGVATLFYFVIKSILEGDRRERLAQARWEAEHSASGAAPETPGSAPSPKASGARTDSAQS